MVRIVLRFALSAININQCWQIVPLYKEIISRGHHADVFASLHNSSSFIPLNLENIPWEALETVSADDLQTPYDVVIESDRTLSDYALSKTGFSIGYFPGGCGHWLTTGDNLPALARHTLWIGHHRFEQESRIIQGHSGEFPIIGMPSLSNYKNYKEKKSSKPLKGLYLNGPPFEKSNKKRFTQFLQEFAKKNPQIELLLKERFLGKEVSNHYELGSLELERMKNVHIYDGYASAVELVKEADFLIGLSTTAFIEALYLKKPVFIPVDFDTEFLYGVRTGGIYPQCLEGFTKVKAHDFINNFESCFINARKLSLEGYLSNFPHNDPCHLIIDIAEIIHEAQAGRSIDKMNIQLPFESLDQFKRDIHKWMQRVDTDREHLSEEREDNLYLMTVFSEVLRRVRTILPNLPQERYETFVDLFKSEFSKNRGVAAWQVEIFERIGPLFYNYLKSTSGIDSLWFPSEGTLFDKSSSSYIEEAKREIPSFKESLED